MLTESGNEKEGCLASIVLEGDDEGVDVDVSLGDPGEVVGGVLDLGLNVFFVGSGITVNVTVSIPNAAELVDLGLVEVLFLVMGLVEFLALIKCTLLKIVKYLHNRINGVPGISFGLKHGVHFISVGLSVHSCDRDEKEEDSGGFHCLLLILISLYKLFESRLRFTIVLPF